MKVKVLALCPIPWDGTSYYRGWGVFKDLHYRYGVEFIPYVVKQGGWGWPDFDYNGDILFLQRPGTPEHLHIAEYAKGVGLKLWVDYDDNFFCLPPENRMSESVNDKTKTDMTKVIRLADVVTVSTPKLKEQMDALGAKYCEIIPNALNERLTPPATKYNTKRIPLPPNPAKSVYVWRGSDTHWAELIEHMVPMVDAMTARQDAHFYFFGHNPVLTTRELPADRWTFIKGADIIHYYKQLRSLRPEFMHVVLSSNLFNLCKSNIAWIEATAAGAVCIAPNWEVWQKPGVLNYDNLEQYHDYLAKADWTEEELQDKWKQSMNYIKENLLLTNVNKQRIDIIHKLMDSYDFSNEIQRIPNTMIE